MKKWFAYKQGSLCGAIDGHAVEWAGPGWYGLSYRPWLGEHRWHGIDALVNQSEWITDRANIMHKFLLLDVKEFQVPPQKG